MTNGIPPTVNIFLLSLQFYSLCRSRKFQPGRQKDNQTPDRSYALFRCCPRLLRYPVQNFIQAVHLSAQNVLLLRVQSGTKIRLNHHAPLTGTTNREIN